MNNKVTIRANIKRKAEDLALYRLLPNMITTLGLVIGITSIRFALEGEWERAIICTVTAAVLDGIDGRIAKMLKATSDFGAELDSLCDFANFGVIPAILLYLWLDPKTYNTKILTWSSSVWFILCMAIRLARFNVAAALQVRFFKGVPAPAGAILLLMPVISSIKISEAMSFDFSYYIISINLYTIFVGVLLASRVPTISFKNLTVKRRYIWVVLLATALCAIGIIFYTWYFLPAVAITYLISIPLVYYYAKKLPAPN